MTIQWLLQTVDISAYADGGAHSLTFHSESFGENSGISSFFVDDVKISPPSVCDTPAEVPWLDTSPISGTATASMPSTVSVTLDATGLSGGTYQAALCIQSDDPANRWLKCLC